MRLLIGSKAIKYHFPDFYREPKDTDYIVSGDVELTKSDGIELYRIPSLDRTMSLEGYIPVLSANKLFTLKMSHMFWDINWEKHLRDIDFLKEKGCVLDTELFKELYLFWNGVHGANKRSDLSLSKDEFFDNSVPLAGGLQHDDLHKLINPVPTYTKILVDPNGVEVSEEKYNSLTHQEKIDLVQEEVYVMAYERLAGRTWKETYVWMLKQFVLSHAPLYEAVFILENYKAIRRGAINYKEKIDDELSRNSRKTDES